MNFKLWAIIFFVLIFGCTQTERIVEPDNNNNNNNVVELIETNNKLVNCEENKRYSELQLNIERNKLKELQLVYNNLNTDFYNCYMANFCFNYPQNCLNYLKVDLSIKEVQDFYSRECDSASRDWDKYMSYDTEVNESNDK